MLTTQQFQTLDDLYAFYNVRLFGASLPECIVNLSRRPNSYGFFAHNVWVPNDREVGDPEAVHEISLNPDFMTRPSIDWHSTLVHEMVHLWQFEFGTPSRTAYHNTEWAVKMLELGLMPSSTGQPGGARTGQRMSQYIIEDDRFHNVFNQIEESVFELLRLRYLPAVSLAAQPLKKGPFDPDRDGEEGDSNAGKKSKSGQRLKYTCPCGNNVWGRSGLLIHCLCCDENYTIPD